MHPDLTDLLAVWPYRPGRINVRKVVARDGSEKVQIRLDLGIIQVEASGRPDGQRPYGHDSLLEYHEARFADAFPPDAPGPREGDAGPDLEAELEADLEPDLTADANAGPLSGADQADPSLEDDSPDAPAAVGPSLTSDECRALRDEAAQYYHRYIAMLVLDEYDAVVRDTTRNLRVIDLCSRYAEDPDDAAALEAVRPYVIMMRSRALASAALESDEPKAAIHAIDQGLRMLEAHFASEDSAAAFEQSGEVQMLRSMRDALVPKLPVSQKAELRQRLREALERENYELAAILRDELRLLPD